MLITEGFGDNQLLITEGFGLSVEIVGRQIGDRIVQAKRIGTPTIVGNRLSDRGRILDMEEAA